MPLPSPITLAGPINLSPLARLQGWWRRLTPHRQDRFAVLAPLAAVVLFLAAIVAAFGYLRLEEIEWEQEAVKRDVEYTQQRLRLRLLERQEQLMRIARELSNRELDTEEFQGRAEAIVNQYPELQGLTWIDARRRIKASFGTASLPISQMRVIGSTLKAGDTESTYSLARELQADLLLIDESDGRSAALARHLRITGTIGILQRAAEQDLLDLAEAFARIKETDFWISPKLLDAELERFREWEIDQNR